jgi:hypothetical protein
MEIEENLKINFLDMTLHNHENKIETEWYTKTTWSGRYLNFHSKHPISQKKSVVIGLADRALKLSSPKFQNTSAEKAKQILIKNSYPKKLINSIFKSRTENLNKTQPQNVPKNKTDNFVSVPYVPDLSEKLQRYLAKENITICHKSHNILNKYYSKLKTKTAKNKKTHIIYQIPCNNCPGVYIGQTTQYLQNRLNGHKYDKKNKTALTNHITQTSHNFNYEETKILKTEINQQKREFLEMIFIKKNEFSVNDRSDIDNLNRIYYNVLK